jgi:hypothetical protein
MTLQLNNPKSPRVTTPAAAHQANSPPYRTLRNVASAAINHLARTMSPTARRAVAPPPCREARDELKPPAAFRVTVGRTQLRRLPPGAVGDLDPDDAVPGLTATVTVSPAAPEPECRTLLLKISLTSKIAESLHGCPDPSTSPTNKRAARARSARPASVTLSRTAALAITAPALPRPPRPREIGRAAGGRREMHAQLRRERQAGATGLRGPSSVARPWSWPPSVAVRARPTVSHTAPWPRFPSVMRPWTPQHSGLRRYKLTHDGTNENSPPAARQRS